MIQVPRKSSVQKSVLNRPAMIPTLPTFQRHGRGSEFLCNTPFEDADRRDGVPGESLGCLG